MAGLEGNHDAALLRRTRQRPALLTDADRNVADYSANALGCTSTRSCPHESLAWPACWGRRAGWWSTTSRRWRRSSTKLFSLLSIAVLLASCGSDTPGSSPPEPFPRSIGYKSLAGRIKGDLLGLSIAQSFAADCQAGISCLSSFHALVTKQEFQDYVAQSPGGEFNKPRILAAGNAADFSQEQIWASKLGRL